MNTKTPRGFTPTSEKQNKSSCLFSSSAVGAKPRSGFTLIELLVVIAIIGLLASVVLASLNAARAKARNARRLQDLKQVQTALELYRNDNGAYPITGASLYFGNCATYSSGGAHGGTSGSTGWVPNVAPTYISVLPLDPQPIPPGNCYLYRSDNGTEYTLLAYLTVEGGALAPGAPNARYPATCPSFTPPTEASYSVESCTTADCTCW